MSTVVNIIKIVTLLALVVAASSVFSSTQATAPDIRAAFAAATMNLPGVDAPRLVLVFTKTAGFRHDSIPDGVAALKALGAANRFAVEATEDASVFTAATLAHFRCVVFLSTTMDVLNPEQEQAFEAYIQSGGGYVGIHAATDTEYDWPWYSRLVGGQFADHGPVQSAALDKLEGGKLHSSTAFLPARWERTDEWYNFKRLNPETTKLYNLDESSLAGSGKKMGADHPVAWFHQFDGGRAWYTAGGHTPESFSEPLFMQHLLEGVRWAGRLDQDSLILKDQLALPAAEHFITRDLAEDLEDPMQIAELPTGEILILERNGALKQYSPATGLSVLAQMDVFSLTDNADEDEWYEGGGLGLAVDPDFIHNQNVYIYYSRKHQAVIRLARFKLDATGLSDEIALLEVPDDRGNRTCHLAGGLAFGTDRLLYLSIGDTTNPFESQGYCPIDERAGRYQFDAQRSAGNSYDLRGSILRIRIDEDGSGYSIPEGNLWQPGTAMTRPEIFVKGVRNPWRFAVDSANGAVAFGDVGPDAGDSSAARGPRGYDVIGYAQAAGYYGWPYFRGDGYYREYDFARREPGESFANGIVNNSPNNTGLRELPPVQKPLIWYPYALSEEFPELGKGGRNADVSVVYNQEGRSASFPAWFHRVLIAHDWMRPQLKLIKLTASNTVDSIQDFLPGLQLKHPSHMIQSADGSLYVLDYGSLWTGNKDGRLIHVAWGGWGHREAAEADVPAIDSRLAGLDPALPGTQLITANGCVACHSVTVDNIGPAFTDIAKRYQGEAGARAMFEGLSQGSQGKWVAHSPMPPFAHLSETERRAIVDAVQRLHN